MNKAYFVLLRRKLFQLFILLLVVLACGLPKGSIAPTSSPEFSNNILISLTDPVDGEVYTISAGLSVRGEAISDGPITHMELWADGVCCMKTTQPQKMVWGCWLIIGSGHRLRLANIN